MRVRIGRIVLAALVVEVLGIALLFALVALLGPNESAAARAYAEQLGQWVGPIGGAVLTVLASYLLTRRLPSEHVRNGLAVGVAAAAIDIAILVLSRAPFQMVFAVSNTARLLAAALGG